MKKTKSSSLKEKIFIPRDSLFTKIFADGSSPGLYKLLVELLMIGIFRNILHEVFNTGSERLSIIYIIIAFGNIHIALLIWCVMIISVCLILEMFRMWALMRDSSKNTTNISDIVFTILLIMCVVVSFYFIPYFTWKYDISFIGSIFIGTEHTRLLMKMYAFIRSQIPEVLSNKTDKKNMPNFSHILYFLFAPTYLYRDSYPRTKNIRWSFVTRNLLEIIGAIFAMSLVASYHTFPELSSFATEPYTYKKIFALFINCTGHSIILCSSLYIIVIHSWQNMWAEMLQFADREFYSDWWNAKNYYTYYRKWNILVHDFCYTYGFKDLHDIVVPGNKMIASLTVFLLSALVHEYIMMVIMKFFIPMLFTVFFVTSVIFIILGKYFDIENTHFCAGVFLGNGFLYCGYSLEYFARRNCPKYDETFADFFIPRMFTCYKMISA